MNNLMNTWKTPWSCSALDDITIRDCHDELNIAEVIGPNVRARIVACVNACDGVSNEALAGASVAECVSENERLRGIVPETLEKLNDDLCAENDRMRAALQAFAGVENFNGWHDKYRSAIEQARAALAEPRALPLDDIKLALTREQAEALATALDYDLDDLSTVGVDIEDDECYTRVKEVRALLTGFGL